MIIEPGDEFRAGRSQLLFTSDHLYFNETGNYSPSADGQRFIMMKPVESDFESEVPVPTNLVLVENFDEELKQLVPPDPQ